MMVFKFSKPIKQAYSPSLSSKPVIFMYFAKKFEVQRKALRIGLALVSGLFYVRLRFLDQK